MLHHMRIVYRFLLVGALSATALGQSVSLNMPASSGQTTLRRVTGIGGIFFKAKNPDSLRVWYRTHLGLDLEPWGGAVFNWQSKENPTGEGTTVWGVFNANTKYFAPSTSEFMINYRVDDLDALLRVLRIEGCSVDAKTDSSEFGKFGWVMDPEGNKIELWQPPKGR